MSSFLHKLWDETVAGPPPDSGLGKLRKYDSFSASQSPPIKISDDIPISRSITIRRTKSNFLKFSDDHSGSGTDSLSGVSSPRTPNTPGTPGADFRRFSWRKSAAESSEPDA